MQWATYLVSVQCCSFRVVLLRKAHAPRDLSLGVKELLGPAVTTHFHLLQLRVLPLVHSCGPNKAKWRGKVKTLELQKFTL